MNSDSDGQKFKIKSNFHLLALTYILLSHLHQITSNKNKHTFILSLSRRWTGGLSVIPLERGEKKLMAKNLRQKKANKKPKRRMPRTPAKQER
jgi:hypothetical protein